ncbi:hypothetical protein [Chryseobacterium hagamense]|uniref:Uncharacterized protein n=1 Tax=Chryseobacterium hagamense TaxID=395935 RepID=A0A511YSJ7_9FLAO|nr:hypothetical protein [Chryseobacterium hagamense]GEN78155.1 hypothetical protein CHA01nite_38950 [Chryseobacterium hagamense]
MKSLYITLFLACGLHAYAQENRKDSETQVQEAVNYKEAKAFEAEMITEAQQRTSEKPSVVKLASEQGLAVKPQTISHAPQDHKEKLLSSRNLTIQEIRKTIPKD